MVKEIILLNPPEGTMKTKRYKKSNGGYGYMVGGKFASKAKYEAARRQSGQASSKKATPKKKKGPTPKTVKASPGPGKKKVEHKVVKKTRRSPSGKLFNAYYLKRNPGVVADFVMPGLVGLGAVGLSMLLAGYLDKKVVGTLGTADSTGKLSTEGKGLLAKQLVGKMARFYTHVIKVADGSIPSPLISANVNDLFLGGNNVPTTEDWTNLTGKGKIGGREAFLCMALSCFEKFWGHANMVGLAELVECSLKLRFIKFTSAGPRP